MINPLGDAIAIDYKNDDVVRRLDTNFPDGIDVYFDNVGGELLDDVLARIRRHARIVICGRIAEYLKDSADYHRYRNVHRIALMDSKMEGFFVYDYQQQFKEAEETLANWIRSGDLDPLEDILDGIESMPSALIGLYEGSNVGGRAVRIKCDNAHQR